MSLGIHDCGSDVVERAAETPPLVKLDRPYAYWERQVHVLAVWCISHGLFKVDELRRAVEGLEPALYASLGYYEKWTAAIVALLVEHGHLKAADIEDALRPADDTETTERILFTIGDRVAVRTEEAMRRWRRPHIRVPGYIHGAVGTVFEVLGAFPNPLYSAYGEITTHYQPLYRVRFAARDVWGATAGSDSLELDLFQHWLQPPPPPQSLSAGAAAPAAVVAPWVESKYEDDHDHDHDEHEHHHHHHDHEGHSHGQGEPHPHEHAPRRDTECKAVANELEDALLRPLATALFKLVATDGAPRQLRPAAWCDDQQPLTMQTLASMVSAMDAKMQKSLGGLLVAKAWSDPAFKALLLSDPTAAASQLGIATSNYAAEKGGFDISLYPSAAEVPNAIQVFQSGHTVLRVVESTPTTHHLVVCTLCSCYPASVLGTSPDWYKGRYYRSRAIRDPRGLLKDEFGLDLPAEVNLVVHDSTAEVRYLVLPLRPQGTEGWSEAELARIVTRDSMIGTAQCDATKMAPAFVPMPPPA